MSVACLVVYTENSYVFGPLRRGNGEVVLNAGDGEVVLNAAID